MEELQRALSEIHSIRNQVARGTEFRGYGPASIELSGVLALLVAAAGNAEVARCHHEVTERIRIIRRLDFTQQHRIDTTYDEHGQILRALIRRRADEANRLLRSHIGTSKAEVRKITLHRLYTARSTKRA